MSKVFTTRRPVARGFVQQEDWAQEAHEVLAEFNGALAAEQLPLEDFDHTKFKDNTSADGEVFNTPSGATDATAVRMPTALYATTQSAVTDFNGYTPPSTPGAGILGPAQKTYATNGNDWAPGWNRLSKYISKGVFLSMPMRDGMVKGCAIADIEFYYGDATVYGLASSLTGSGWRYELGVFLDGNLLARTGMFPPRRHTHTLPFSFPTSTRRSQVDVRWRGIFDGAGSNQDYAWVSDSAIKFLNTSLWAMNRYR